MPALPRLLAIGNVTCMIVLHLHYDLSSATCKVSFILNCTSTSCWGDYAVSEYCKALENVCAGHRAAKENNSYKWAANEVVKKKVQRLSFPLLCSVYSSESSRALCCLLVLVHACVLWPISVLRHRFIDLWTELVFVCPFDVFRSSARCWWNVCCTARIVAGCFLHNSSSYAHPRQKKIWAHKR